MCFVIIRHLSEGGGFIVISAGAGITSPTVALVFFQVIFAEIALAIITAECFLEGGRVEPRSHYIPHP